MKTDLDSIMEARGIDALLVSGPAQHNAAMFYLTGGAHLTNADVIKERGKPAVLFHYPMERDEAAHTGLTAVNLGSYRIPEMIQRAGGDVLEATAQRYQKMLEQVGITHGRLALYGKIEAGYTYAVFKRLQALMPAIEIVGEVNDVALLQARATKDEVEIERIRQMGRLTVEVVDEVANFLSTRPVRDQMLLNSDGNPLTIGEVKARINFWISERGAENPDGTIFAIGRDAGVPHSSGNAGDVLHLGQTIVFDIFPCEAGGGYYYDFTRTWCLGYAPDAAQALYEDVHAVYQQIMSELKSGGSCPEYQKRTCELFSARGHATIEDDPQVQDGYVHSLGHGLGLDVHERPWFGSNAGENDLLLPGVVVTIEPGLYYPSQGMGVRLEDTVWLRPDGEFEILAPYGLDFVLPVRS